ncbi:MAG TPA: class I SAM-dependent methyltransferase [Planctomycetaceae bacterium]|nr:methyltransferase domain-containing protein [Alphaproteobacteria bacterium HT1-32]HAW26758.1 class I SAM-dependent methyltransferase [Planctomycetaceae bacterium]
MTDTRFRLFEDLASRYDLHTPHHHYEDDHSFVLDSFRSSGHQRILDIGCGTGVFLRKALDEGFDAAGIDAAQGMVNEAMTKAGSDRAKLQAMEDLDADSLYDGICALSWVINYATDVESARDILVRCRNALKPGGKLLLQTAHAPNMDGLVLEDRETGPSDISEDIVFLFQFHATGVASANARYVYAAKSIGELVWEEHPLNVANAELLAGLCSEAGFHDISIYGSYQREPLGNSISPWIEASVPA